MSWSCHRSSAAKAFRNAFLKGFRKPLDRVDLKLGNIVPLIALIEDARSQISRALMTSVLHLT